MARVRLAVLALSLAGWSLLIGILGGVLGPTIALLAYFSSRKAISDEWAREWAAQRPVVYPVLDQLASGGTSKPYLPLKNGGRGPALNVIAELKFKPPGKGDFRVVAGTIAAGDVVAGKLSIGIAPPWGCVSGELHYSDLAGGSYVSPFEFSNGPGGLELELGEQQHVTPVDAKAAERGR